MTKMRLLMRILAWVQDNRSLSLSLLVAGILYLSYAAVHDAWLNPSLLLVAVFVGLHLPDYSRISNRIEEVLQHRSGTLTLGRVGRFAFQFAFNATVFALFLKGGVLPAEGFVGIGGVLAAAAVTTVASQGIQYAGQMAYRYGYGHPDTNVLLGLAFNVFLASVATAGLPLAQQVFLLTGLVFGGFVFGWGVLSDLRAVVHPKGGVAVFFGTFNPFHVGHLGLVKRVIAERGVEKVVIHPTILPRFHADALARGEIRVARIENGLQVYELTEKADPKVNYFPTGNRFFAPEWRRDMIELAIADAGLSDKVEVAFMPQIYADRGFRGVFREIRRQNPGKPIHGVHGSDFGAMLVRTIMDESGWHYPFPVVRKGEISATAIRAGAQGMTTPSVTAALAALRGPQSMAPAE